MPLFEREPQCLEGKDRLDALRLLQPSAHWWRHASASTVVPDRVPIGVVNALPGLATFITFSQYVQAGPHRVAKEMSKLWARRGSGPEGEEVPAGHVVAIPC